jgi:hypothetical protein
MAATYRIELTTINDSTPLGPDYLDVLNTVAQKEGRPPLKNHASMSPQTSFLSAVEFLTTAIQT